MIVRGESAIIDYHAPFDQGFKFVESEDRLIQDESIVEQELAIKADKRCMNLVQKIGNSIHPSISLEVDYPSQHVDGKLPILDFQSFGGVEADTFL